MTAVDEFGPDVHLTPTWYRPHWLAADENIRWSCNGRPYVDARAGEVRQWGDPDNRVSIRLRADHPHYRNTPAPEREGELSPGFRPLSELVAELKRPDDALVERMVALVRSVAQYAPGAFTEVLEARAIVAELPEVVDADLVEARRIACESSRWTPGDDAWRNVEEGRSDHIPMVRAALAAMARGRQLEREAK